MRYFLVLFYDISVLLAILTYGTFPATIQDIKYNENQGKETIGFCTGIYFD